MKRLLKRNAVLHAVAWIGIYVGSVNVFDVVSASIGVQNLATSLGLFGLSTILFLYLKKQGMTKTIGLAKVDPSTLQKCLYFIPLGILALSQFTGTFNTSLTIPQIMIFGLLMLNVGFIEEVIFRGLLYKAIRDKSGRNRAILISGLTFGLGHIVNLLRGMSIEHQFQQIAAAIVLGIMLALIVEVSKSILPGVIFHVLFNFSSTIMVADATTELYLLVSILTLAALYTGYLYLTQIGGVRNITLRNSQTNH
jgi:membrane protease YdiL (CAAX protease family)